MKNLREAIEHLRPGAQFTTTGDDYGKVQWNDKINDDRKLPTLEECEAVQLEANELATSNEKHFAARRLINKKRDKVLLMMLKFVATLPDCPDPLKALAVDIAIAETDLKGDD